MQRVVPHSSETEHCLSVALRDHDAVLVASREHLATPAGFENKVGFVWKIADKLRGHLKPHEYGSVMLPTLVLFRLDAVLEPTKPAVLARAQGLDLMSASADALLKRAAGGLPFYNTSPLPMKTILSDDKNIAAQLQTYVAGQFTARVGGALTAPISRSIPRMSRGP